VEPIQYSTVLYLWKVSEPLLLSACRAATRSLSMCCVTRRGKDPESEHNTKKDGNKRTGEQGSSITWHMGAGKDARIIQQHVQGA